MRHQPTPSVSVGWSRCRRNRRPGIGRRGNHRRSQPGGLYPDRRPAVHQLHRDAHHQRRLADAARSDRHHRAGLALSREPGRADGKGGRPAGELLAGGWGIVTAGTAAALTHATAACIAGTDPEKMQRLPNLEGLKDEVIMPRESRIVYDHAVRTLGVKIIEVNIARGAARAPSARIRP